MDGHARRAAFVDESVVLIKRVLRERWPSVPFTVAPRVFAAFLRVDIHWSDGPTRMLVAQVVETTLAAATIDGDAMPVEPHTQRTLTEAGCVAALRMITGEPPFDWIQPNGEVSWARFALPDSLELMEEFTLPERPVSVHHLAALLANRLDLTLALSHRRW